VGKEEGCIFLVYQKAQPDGYKGSTVWVEKERGADGIGGWGGAWVVKAMKICTPAWPRDDRYFPRPMGLFPSFTDLVFWETLKPYSSPKSNVIPYFHFQLPHHLWGMKSICILQSEILCEAGCGSIGS
jgi:hypothetical protein